MTIYLLLFIPLFAVLNRLAGRDPWVPFGRNIYAVILLAGLATYLLTGHALLAACIALAWTAYRIPGWGGLHDGGRNSAYYDRNPEGAKLKSLAQMIPRQSYYAAGFLPLAYAGHLTFAQMILLVTIVGVGGAQSYWIGVTAYEQKGWQPTIIAEVLAGVFLGMATMLAAVAVLS